MLLLLQALHAAPLTGHAKASDAVEALWSWAVNAVNTAHAADSVAAVVSLVATAAPVVAVYAPTAITAAAADLVQALLCLRGAAWLDVVMAMGTVVHAAQGLGWTVPCTVRKHNRQ